MCYIFLEHRMNVRYMNNVIVNPILMGYNHNKLQHKKTPKIIIINKTQVKMKIPNTKKTQEKSNFHSFYLNCTSYET